MSLGLGLTIGGWFAPEIIAKLISITFSYLGDQYNRQSDAINDLHHLQQAHPKIRAVVSAAKQGHIKTHPPDLNQWLSNLTDAADDAENILDELLYLKLQQQVKSGRNKVRQTASRFKKTMRNAIRIDPTLEKLKGVVKKLVVVAGDADVFLNLIAPHQEPRTANTRETSSLLSVPSGKVLGREMERGELMKQLQRPRLDSNSGDLAVIPVVGMGGIGKTTLVQHVYNDKAVEEYFDLRMWVCVSDVCDVGLLTRKLVEAATGVTPQVSSLDMLQRSLANELAGKRFLLVLDDVWNEKDWSFWEKLFTPLRSGSRDSKVVVTTRMEVVANAMKGVVEKLSLDGLSDEDCWLLLKERAFNDEDWNDNHQLCSIGYQIASKLKGSPLAAKTLGGLLRSKLDEDHWRDILESDMLDLEQGETDIMPVLRLSYQHLPPHLQSCFAYCSIFPQDYCFLKKDLVQMWVSAGLIQELPKPKETIEDVGYRYLEELVNKSFLDHSMDRDCFVMHDLLHDLARYVSSGECLRVAEGATGDIPNSIRHLSLSIYEPFELYKLLGIKHLRTLHLSIAAGGPAFHEALGDVFQSSRGLRVLKLSSYCEIKLPSSIGDLIHLRYLNLSGTDSLMLPESISQLYHLQVLKAGERLSSQLEFIPHGLNNLISLRHVKSDYVVSMIPGVGKLTSLQELSEFNVKRKRGYRIEELSTMTELRELGIGSLENVISYQEACSAKLNKKEHLNSLVLKWGWDADISWAQLDERVLDGLQPHANLKNLTIEFYTGSRPPFWMNASMIPNVKCLCLNNCEGLEYLPPLEQLPHLRVLHLRQMSALKQFGPRDFQGDRVDMFPSLKELRIEEMPELAEWYGGVEDCWYPHLQELSIKSCPKLMELPALPPSLIMLDIKGTGLLTLPRWPWIRHEHGIAHSSNGAEVLKRPSPLRSVFLQDCMELASLGCSELLLSIKKLRITGCPTLNAVTLPVTMEAEDGFLLPLQQLIIDYTSLLVILPVLVRSTTSLIRSVTIYKCFNITSLPAEVEHWLLQNKYIEELELYGADSLQTLPRDMQCLSSLRSLYLANAYELESLPDLPASLEQLNFFGYSSPMLQRCTEGSDYWSKIAHIRNVCFVFGGSRSIR